MQVKNQLFEEITKEYSLQILKWAYKKCGDSDRAEELTQEVMVQIFSAIQKSTAEGKRIEQVEHFVWKIARYVWCHSLRKSAHYVMCPLEEDLRDESDFAGELAEREEQKLMITQLRKQVSRLNYLQREILVTFYIDGLPQKTIAEKLGISESAVKWHLHDTRQKLKKEMAEDMKRQTEKQECYKVYGRLRKQVSDVIVKGLLEAEDKIRAVGFHGSDLPMEKLLWVLIYTFCGYYQYEDEDRKLEHPIRPDGGRYFPLGYLDDSDLIQSWEVDNRGFAYNGPLKDEGFSWFGLYNFEYSGIIDMIDRFTPENDRMNRLLVELVSKEFDISFVGEERKHDLAKLVEQGYVRVQGERVVPQFVVMTGTQLKALYTEVFADIAAKLQPGYARLKEELKKLHGEKLPKHLKEVSRLPFVQSLYAMQYVTSLLAFKDDLLYVPKDSAEGEFLTPMYVDWEK